jgi:signal transduction histidine kinase
MSRHQKSGLRIGQQLILLFLVPLVLMSVIATFLSTYVLLQSSLPMILQENTSDVQAVAADLLENLNYYKRSLETTSDALARYSGDSAQLQQMLKEFTPYLVRFDGGVMFLNSQGIAIASTPDQVERLGGNYSSNDFFQTPQRYRQTIFSRVVQMQPENRNSVVIATPVIHNQALVGVLVGVFFLDVHNWEKDLGPQHTLQDRQVILIDITGNVIYSSNPEYINGSVSGNPDIWKLVAEGRPGSIMTGELLSSKAQVISFTKITGLYWGLIYQKPFKALKILASPYQYRVISPIIIGIFLFMILFLINSRRISKPLMALVGGAITILEGDPFSNLKVEGPIELQTLTDSFNKLANRLQEQQESMRQYANHILESQESEREQLSRELHDEPIQDLVALIQRIELYNGLLETDPQAAKQRLDEVKLIAEKTVNELRRISHDLRPFILEDLGLPAAIQALCDDLSNQMQHASIQFLISGEEVRLDPKIELTVYRIVQEALTNIRKHAFSANQIDILLTFEHKGVSAVIQNNGPSYEPQEITTLVREGHLGVAGMMERARLYSGNIKIESDSVNHTRITLYLPYTKNPI